MGAAVAEANNEESKVGESLAAAEGEKGNGASVWQLCGDKDAARTWRRWLHGLGVEWRWRAVSRQHRRDVVGGDRATVASPHTRGRALAGTRSHGPSWAAGKRALPLKLFSKLTKYLRFKTKVFPMSKNTQILQDDILKHKKQLSLLAQLQIPS
jgi:hypothetical protein